MKTKMFPVLFLLVCACAIMLTMLQCTRQVSGTGHEVEAKVAGFVLDSTGAGVENINVYLLPNDYNPAFDETQPYTATTNSKGYFAVDSVPAGRYVLNGNDAKKVLYLYHPEIEVTDSGCDTGFDTLKTPIRMIIYIPDSISGKNSYLFVPGTEFYITVDMPGISELDVPNGIVDIVNIRISNDVIISEQKIIEDYEASEADTVDLIGLMEIPKISGNDEGFVDSVQVFHISNYSSELSYVFYWGNKDSSIIIKDSVANYTWTKTGTYKVNARATKKTNNSTIFSPWSNSLIIVISEVKVVNLDTILPPTIPVGPDTVYLGKNMSYTTGGAINKSGDIMEYQFSTGDGALTAWSIDTVQECKWGSKWGKPGTYYLATRARSQKNTSNISLWSDSLQILVKNALRFNTVFDADKSK